MSYVGRKVDQQRARELRAIMVLNGLTDELVAKETRYTDKYVNGIRNGRREVNAKNSRIIEYIESYATNNSSIAA